MTFQVLHSGHGVYHFSQSGCKLLFFTDYGMRHVIAYLGWTRELTTSAHAQFHPLMMKPFF